MNCTVDSRGGATDFHWFYDGSPKKTIFSDNPSHYITFISIVTLVVIARDFSFFGSMP